MAERPAKRTGAGCVPDKGLQPHGTRMLGPSTAPYDDVPEGGPLF